MATMWDADQDYQVQSHPLRKDGFWGRLVLAVSRASSAAASNEDERQDFLRKGLDALEALARAVNPEWWERTEDQPILAWRHRARPSLAYKKRLEPYILRLEVEEGAAGYLALPYRVDELDRLIADMLMASEMFAFADEMQPQLKQRLPTGLSWVWGNLKSLVIGLAIAGVLLWLAPDSSAAQWAAGIVAVLTIGGTALSAVLFPFFYPAARAQREKFNATVMSMVDAYTTLNGSPSSVPHVRKMIDRATDAGVVWPAPLMALLDDIEARRKSI